MDLVTGVEGYLKSGLLPFYYAILLLGALYVLFIHKFKPIAIFVVMLFWEGLFVYLGRNSYVLMNLYKIGFAAYAFFLFGNKLSITATQKEKTLNIVFILLGFLFLFSTFSNESDILSTASQFVKKYGIPFLFLYGIKREMTNPL
jgi:hypothetical protein